MTCDEIIAFRLNADKVSEEKIGAVRNRKWTSLNRVAWPFEREIKKFECIITKAVVPRAVIINDSIFGFFVGMQQIFE